MAKRRRPATLTNPTLQHLLGQTFIQRLTLTDDAHAPLRIGTQRWSTHDLAVQLGVVHTRAARLLTAAADSIGATSVHDLYVKSSPYTFAGIRGLGETTIYVLWRLFESAGLDPDAWAERGARDQTLATFHTLKKREQQAEARTMRAEQRRKRNEKNAAHERAVAAEMNK